MKIFYQKKNYKKAAAIKRFESKLKKNKQTDIAKNQYQGLGKVYVFNKKHDF